MSRRASLPGAEELFRKTSSGRSEGSPKKSSSGTDQSPQSSKSTKLQVASDARAAEASAEGKRPKHEEKITFYCTAEDLMALEQARLRLRSEQGLGVDRGRIVRAALDYALEDYAARGEDSILLRKLEE